MEKLPLGYLFTGDFPGSQAGRWAMISGLMDCLAGTPHEPGIVARVLANPQDGTFGFNEAMNRISRLTNMIRRHPSLAAIPDRAKQKAEMLIESDAYHTLITMDLATRPRDGKEHALSVVLLTQGSERFWDGVPDRLPHQWSSVKAETNRPHLLRPLSQHTLWAEATQSRIGQNLAIPLPTRPILRR